MANGNRVVAEEVRKPVPVVGARRNELVWTFSGGVSVGFVVWIIAFLLQRFVFSNLLCAGTLVGCNEAIAYSGAVAMIVGAIVGLIILTTTQMYRPLLVVVAATLSLWGFGALTVGMKWYGGLLLSMVIFGLAYATFAWLTRIRNFIATLVVLTVLIVLVRIAIG